MAKISATPNPIMLSSSETSGATRIDWDTESDDRGRVYVSVNGAAEVLFDGQPQRGNRQGSKNQTVAIGQTHLFRLRQVNAANTLLATTTVTAKQPPIIPGGGRGGVAVAFNPGLTYLAELTAAQTITDVTIRPGLHDVEFTFRTNLATVPIVEIYRDASENAATSLVTVVFPIFAGPRTKHVLKLGEPPRLAQDTGFFFKIFAATPRPYTSPGATLRGSFITARQDIRVIFDRIVMVRDGDPSSSGDMMFTFGVGDAETKEPFFGPSAPSHKEDLDDGDTAYVNKQFDIPNAPRRLWAEVVGEDDDRSILTGLAIVGMKPTGTGRMTGSWEIDGSEGAWVQVELDTFVDDAMVEGFHEVPFSMATGNFGVAFHVHGRLQVNAFPRPKIRMLSYVADVGSIRSMAEAKAMIVAGNGDRKSGRAWMASLGPDGAVYAKTVSQAAPNLPRHQWTRLGGRFTGALTAIAADKGALDLFALDAEGAVFHRSHADGETAEGDWRELGGSFEGLLAAALGPQGRVALFGTDREGNVHHISVESGRRGTARGKWQNLGGRIAGPPVAVNMPGRGLGLFALGRDGKVLHKRRTARDWLPSTIKWESLGGNFKGALDARPLPEGGVLLIVLTQDRMLHTLIWADYPGGAPARRWEKTATLDSAFESLLPTPEDVPARPLPPRKQRGDCD